MAPGVGFTFISVIGFGGECSGGASVTLRVFTGHAPPCWVSGFICPCLLLPSSVVGHIGLVCITCRMFFLKLVSGCKRTADVQAASSCWHCCVVCKHCSVFVCFVSRWCWVKSKRHCGFLQVFDSKSAND